MPWPIGYDEVFIEIVVVVDVELQVVLGMDHQHRNFSLQNIRKGIQFSPLRFLGESQYPL